MGDMESRMLRFCWLGVVCNLVTIFVLKSHAVIIHITQSFCKVFLFDTQKTLETLVLLCSYLLGVIFC
jgi:hypothetical protein